MAEEGRILISAPGTVNRRVLFLDGTTAYPAGGDGEMNDGTDAVRGYPIDRVGESGVKADVDRVTIEEPLGRLPARRRFQRVFGGRSRRVRQRSMTVGRTQASSTPATIKSTTAIRNAIPMPRQDRVVMKPSYELSAISYQLVQTAN